jgi:hypothetical protein
VSEEEAATRVTPAQLRRGDEMCRRRLAHELRGGKKSANKVADMRFAVSNRVEADARLAQQEPGPVHAEAFVDPTDLEPEQVALYRAARRGYLECFGALEGATVELAWGRALPSLDAELVANPGIGFVHTDGTHETRRIRVGSGMPLDAVDVAAIALITEEWAPSELAIVWADVLTLDEQRLELDVARERADALEFVETRVERLRELAADGRARAGRDCLGCPFIAGCSEHT